MKRQVGISCPKKINFIKENKKNLSLLSKKNQRRLRNPRSLSFSSPPVQDIPIKLEILKKKSIPKSQIPGFDFKLSLPNINNINTPLKYWVSDEKSLFPKESFSDIGYPPSPPKDALEVIKEISYENHQNIFESPLNENCIDQSTQIENSCFRNSEIYLRRSERLAKKKELKRKLLNTEYKCKRIKYN
jgi:hypothetical protein